MAAQLQAQLAKIMLGCQGLLAPGNGEECIGRGLLTGTMEADRKRGGGECLCKGSQQTCLFIFFSDLISLRLLFCDLVQVRTLWDLWCSQSAHRHSPWRPV